MKQVQFIGARSKSDILIYIAHTIANAGKRVLIVDTSLHKEYKYSYSLPKSEEIINVIQNIEFISEIRTKESLVQKLKQANEKVENFDYLLIDIFDTEAVENWVSLENNYYVSDNDRYSIMNDVDILNEFVDVTEMNTINRIHFESPYQVNEGYIHFLLNNRIEAREVVSSIEFDEKHLFLKQHIQHEYEIPFKKISKEYKEAVAYLVTEIMNVSFPDLKGMTKQSLSMKTLGFFKKQNLSPNKNESSPTATIEKPFQELKGVK